MHSILIVDDQRGIRHLLSEELIREGYRVESAGDAESARAFLESSRPDLVLLDLFLDGHGPDGFEVLREIKRQDSNLPVIIVTAYDSYVHDPRLSQADGYVIKSVDFMELKQKVARALRKKKDLQGKVETISHQPQVGVVPACSCVDPKRM